MSNEEEGMASKKLKEETNLVMAEGVDPRLAAMPTKSKSPSIRHAEGLPPLLPGAPVTPMELLARAVERGATIEVLNGLFDLQQRWEASQGRKAFDLAIAAAKGEIPIIKKNRVVDFTTAKGRTNYKFEDLAEIIGTVDPILAKHGLNQRFRVSSNLNEPVIVTCIISHRDGHFEETTLSAGRDESGNKNSIQSIGSTVTYLQRYTLKAALGLAAAEDDDGRGAGVGAPNLISAEQVKMVVDACDKIGYPKETLCERLGIDGIAMMAAKDLPTASAILHEYKQHGVIDE